MSHSSPNSKYAPLVSPGAQEDRSSEVQEEQSPEVQADEEMSGTGTANGADSKIEKVRRVNQSAKTGLGYLAGLLSRMVDGLDSQALRVFVLVGGFIIAFSSYIVPGMEEEIESEKKMQAEVEEVRRGDGRFSPGESREAYVMDRASQETFLLNEVPTGNLFQVVTYGADGQATRRWVHLIGTEVLPPRMSPALRSRAERLGLPADKGALFGKAARAAVQKMTGGRTLTLQYIDEEGKVEEFASITQAREGRTRDRPLSAYVWVLSDGGQGLHMLNEELIRAGFALNQEEAKHPFKERFKEAALQARRFQRGLWAPNAKQPSEAAPRPSTAGGGRHQNGEAP